MERRRSLVVLLVAGLAAGCPEKEGLVVPELPPPPQHALCEEAVEAEFPRSPGRVEELAISSIEGAVLVTTFPDVGDPVVTVHWRSKGWAAERLEGAFSGAFSWDGRRVLYWTAERALRVRSLDGEDTLIVDQVCDFKVLGDPRLIAVRSGDCAGATLPALVIYADTGDTFTPLGRQENVRSTLLANYDVESRRLLLPVWGGDRCECAGPTALAEDLVLIELPLGEAPTARTIARGSGSLVYGWLEDGRALTSGTSQCGCAEQGVRALDPVGGVSTSLFEDERPDGLLFDLSGAANDHRVLGAAVLWTHRPRISIPFSFLSGSAECQAYREGGRISSGLASWRGPPYPFVGACEVVGRGSEAVLGVISDTGVLYRQALATNDAPVMLPYAAQPSLMRRRSADDPWALPVDGEGARGVVRFFGQRVELISADVPFFPALTLQQGQILGLLGAPGVAPRRLAVLNAAGAWTELGTFAADAEEVAVDDRGCVFAVAESTQLRIGRLPPSE